MIVVEEYEHLEEQLAHKHLEEKYDGEKVTPRGAEDRHQLWEPRRKGQPDAAQRIWISQRLTNASAGI
ncbi:hypothetical protein GCK72_004599 [Caenorhabditis remanei]|uniref:Uncharacterized protein n=1 Tax=Caenorhabditis remanei TaxID=31234 RepID=A0A6A5HA14_CAERE|nr:hypothetical protein GCK72_004599 [Caenorhabditis remanei]KAF1764650.1 hypothetical protein GCK72_004599 [Caenorhabditis remanei]